ncbi:MAG: hypothetical protein E6J90_45680 [Deltaproteobacteria bacterium]|nr:MAG: hypothetical protein E6J90_45680 [Deltaproteobacteria bacterium]
MRIIAALIVLGLGSTAAFAEPPGATPQSTPASGELVESYRFQTAAIDAIALATALGTVRNPGAFGEFALGTYLFGAPIIHLVHHRPGRALGSLAMRAGIPLAMGLLLASMHTNSCPADSTQCDDYGAFGLALVGMIGGAVVASVLDTAYLAKGDEPPARSWGPTVAASRGGVALGVAGSF